MRTKRTLSQMRELCETSPTGPNCWNTTMWVHGATDQRNWIDQDVIKNWVDRACMPIKAEDVKIGDICLFFNNRDEKDLWHSAVYIGEGLWFHKRGTHYRYEITSWAHIMLQNIYKDDSDGECEQYVNSIHRFYRVKKVVK